MEDLKTIETVDTSPFKRLCMTIGELPASFVDSMTYYECLAWLVNYLQNTVIPAVNNNAEAVEELQAAFVSLKNYVDNYFENLDVQTEINNKLDAMAQDGTLADIISQYLNSTAIFCYDNVASMKSAENLVDGSYARTLGYYAKNDGGGALYKIRNITNDDVVDEGFIVEITADPQNNLVAELIIENNTVNVKQIGAKGDGVTDDKDVILNATNKVANIYLPTGSYKLSQKIDLSSKSVTIYGDGAKLGRANYSPKTIIISPSGDYAFKTAYPSNCYFSKLSFSGDGIDEMAGVCEKCDFISSNRGIYFVRGRVSDCYFKCDNYGIYQSIDSTISNCIFDSCGVAISLHGNDNRIINNRIDWNTLGIELTGSSYNTIESNLFDRQTTYGITMDNACAYNNITGNLFERNLVNHISGSVWNATINSNKFLKKPISDEDPASEQKPATAFAFTDFRNSNLVGNEIYADKVNETGMDTSNTSTVCGNIVNGHNTDQIRVKIGDVTIAAGADGNAQATWATLKTNILNFGNGANFKLKYLEILQGNNYVYYNGSNVIKNIVYDKYYNINITLHNGTADSLTYNVYAVFDNISIFRINFGS